MFKSPASRGFLAKPIVKPPTDEEVAKKAAEEERKKRVATLLEHEEKMDAVRKLTQELQEARLKAQLASPTLFSPHLNMPHDGFYGLLTRGGQPLMDEHQRLQEYLLLNNPEFQKMSEERRLLYERYQQMEGLMAEAVEQNELLKRENVHLTNTIRQHQHHGFGDFYDDDGADPEYEAELRRRRRHPPPRHVHHRGRAPPPRRREDDYYDDAYEMPSPGFRRAREAERYERERFYGRDRW